MSRARAGQRAARRAAAAAGVGVALLTTHASCGVGAPAAPATREPAPPSAAAAPLSTPATESGSSGTHPVDDTVTLEGPQGLFKLRHSPVWQVVDAPPAEPDVRWLARLERGQPGRPPAPGAKRPPNGVRIDVGELAVPAGADLAQLQATALPLDAGALSLTADDLAARVGPDDVPAIAREGQILPYFGRWREWLVPLPKEPGRALVIRASSFGADELLGMFHAKIVVETLVLDGATDGGSTR